MKTDTQAVMLSFIQERGQARPTELQKHLNISSVAIHKQLHKLQDKGLVTKVGKPPFVFYIPLEKSTLTLTTNGEANKETLLPDNLSALIEQTFLYITPNGNMLNGYNGFLYWVATYKKGADVLSHAQEYMQIWIEKEEKRSPEGWFDATKNIHEAFSDVFIDHLLFEELYSIPTFGRTKVAKIVMHAKESSNKELIDRASVQVRSMIERIIEIYAVDAVAFIPPTVERPLQFMKELAYQLKLPLPQIELIKTKPQEGYVQRSQKSIKDIIERVTNARNTIFLRNSQEKPYKNVLLIDDAAGSGASFNETARKLKSKGIGSNNIVAFSLIGNLNLKKYPVIQQL